MGTPTLCKVLSRTQSPAALRLQDFICIDVLQELWMAVALKEISKGTGEAGSQGASSTTERRQLSNAARGPVTCAASELELSLIHI